MRLKITRRLSLAELGEGWQDCYIDFRPIAFKESQKLADLSVDENDPESIQKASSQAIDLLRDKFVSGRVVTDNGVEDMVADDIDDLPIDVLTQALSLLSGTLEKKD